MDPTIFPEEIWIKILLHCDVPDIIAFGSTCSYLRKISSIEYLWKTKWLQLLSQVQFKFPDLKQLQSFSVNFKGMCYRLHMIITLDENVRFPKCQNCDGYTCPRNCVEELNAKVIIKIGDKYKWDIPSDCLKRRFSIFAFPKHFSKEDEEEESNAVLMFCKPLAINPALRKQLLHYLFQEVKVARVCLVPKPLIACTMLVTETCIVVDSGALNTTVAVVIGGRVMPHRWKLLPVGGWHVAYHLKQAMHWKQNEYHQIPISYLDTLAVKVRCRLSYDIKNEEREEVQKIKEHINFRIDSCNELKQFSHFTFKEQNEPMYQRLSLGSELYIAPEMMYISLGLPEVIKEVIFGLPQYIMHDCLSHILLTGGNTNLSGFKSRLTKDLRELLPEYSEILVIRHCPTIYDWNVAMGFTRTSLATYPDKTPSEYVEGNLFWLSREEYVLFGCDSLE